MGTIRRSMRDFMPDTQCTVRRPFSSIIKSIADLSKIKTEIKHRKVKDRVKK